MILFCSIERTIAIDKRTLETIAIDIAIAKEPLETIAIAIDSQFHYWPTLGHWDRGHMLKLNIYVDSIARNKVASTS